MAFKVNGVDELFRDFDRLPKEAVKVVQKATRTGASAAARHIKAGVPSKFKRVCGSKVMKDKSGVITAYAGLRNREGMPSNGKDMPLWFKAYWSNYGTLANRDPEHQFKYSRKKHTSEWQGGIAHQNFFEAATPGWEEKFLQKFEETFDKEIAKL